MSSNEQRRRYAVCIDNSGYPESLEVRKIYQVLSDARADRHGLARVVDDTGEDYLYPRTFFVTVALPKEVARLFPSVE